MDITIKNLQTKIPIRLPRIRSVVRRTFRHLRINNAELSIVFVTPLRMRSINAQYLKHDYVTDVLTFDYSPAVRRKLGVKKKSSPSSFVHGEIVICPSEALRNAQVLELSVHQEIELYAIHGILHLMGYDDHAPKEIARMRKKEREIMELIVHG